MREDRKDQLQHGSLDRFEVFVAVSASRRILKHVPFLTLTEMEVRPVHAREAERVFAFVHFGSLRVEQETDARPMDEDRRFGRVGEFFQEFVDPDEKIRQRLPASPEDLAARFDVPFFREHVAAQQSTEDRFFRRVSATVDGAHVRVGVDDVHAPAPVNARAGVLPRDVLEHFVQVRFIPREILPAALYVETASQNADPFHAGQRLHHDRVFRRDAFGNSVFRRKARHQSRRFVGTGLRVQVRVEGEVFVVRRFAMRFIAAQRTEGFTLCTEHLPHEQTFSHL